MALQPVEEVLFGPFRAPNTGQIRGWSVAQSTFRTVSLRGSVNKGMKRKGRGVLAPALGQKLSLLIKDW